MPSTFMILYVLVIFYMNRTFVDVLRNDAVCVSSCYPLQKSFTVIPSAMLDEASH